MAEICATGNQTGSSINNQVIDELAAVQIDNKWGFINKSGEIVIAPIYVSVYSFSEGLAGVAVKGGNSYFDDWGFIDKKGMIIIEPHYKSVKPFSEGLAAVSNEGDMQYRKYGYIDMTDKIVIPIQYTTAGYFKNGTAQVEVGGNAMWGVKGTEVTIDKTGKAISQ
jgi:hypothetical protein